MQTILHSEPLTIDQIETLSPHSSQYVIPCNQQKCRMYALILYTTVQRLGGQKEAKYLEDALKMAGFEVITLEWYSSDHLETLFEYKLRPIVDNCSLLMVCLMSNGSRGSVIGNDIKERPVNDILHHLNKLLPKIIPLVSYIHACKETISSSFHISSHK